MTAANLDVITESRAVLLAVKPQQIDAVLREIAAARKSATRRPAHRFDRGGYHAVADHRRARRKSARYSRDAQCARDGRAGNGRDGALARRDQGDEAFALRIFRAVGDAVALKDEALLDPVTALSGSGPAYVYLFVKALADAAANEGIPRELALRMALKTVEGAECNMRMSKLAPAELIRVVASPGGTTEAALMRFAAAGFSDIVAAAVHAAADRSRELGRSY